MTAIAELTMINIDCQDPRALAEFYHQLTGWDIKHSAEDSAGIERGGLWIGFGRVDGYRAPGWPDADGKQFHLDFYTDDLDQSQARVTELGGSTPEFQPGGDRWRVFLDPAGHPFCLCLRS